MTISYRKTQLRLPPEVAEAFSTIEDTEVRDEYVVTLRRQGWTLKSVGDAAGMSRERVRQLAQRPANHVSILTGDLPLPLPPERPVKEPVTYVEPDPDDLERALSMREALQAQSAEHKGIREARAAVTAERKAARAEHAAGNLTDEELKRKLRSLPLPKEESKGQYRRDSEEFTKLLKKMHDEDFVPTYRLALRLGVTHAAVRQRLLTYERNHS